MSFYGKTQLINMNGWAFDKYSTFSNMSSLMRAAAVGGYKSQTEIGSDPQNEYLVDNTNIYVIDYEQENKNPEFTNYNTGATKYKKNYNIDKNLFTDSDFLVSGSDVLNGATYIYNNKNIILSQNYFRLQEDFQEAGYKNGFHGTVWEVIKQSDNSFFFLLVGHLHEEWPQISVETYSPEYATKAIKSGKSFPRINTKTSTPADIRISMAPNWRFQDDINLSNYEALTTPTTIYNKDNDNEKDVFTAELTTGKSAQANSNFLDNSNNIDEFKGTSNEISTDKNDIRIFNFNLGKLNSAIGTLYNQFYGTSYSGIKNASRSNVVLKDTTGKGLLLQVGDSVAREDRTKDWGDPSSMWGNVGTKNTSDLNTMWGNVGNKPTLVNSSTNEPIPLTMWANVGKKDSTNTNTMWGNVGIKNPTTDNEKEANKDTMWGNVGGINDEYTITPDGALQSAPTMWSNVNYMKNILQPMIDFLINYPNAPQDLEKLITSLNNEETVAIIDWDGIFYKLNGNEWYSTDINNIRADGRYEAFLGDAEDSIAVGIFDTLKNNFSSLELSLPLNLTNEQINYIIEQDFTIEVRGTIYWLVYNKPFDSTHPFKLHIEITH